MRLCGAKAGHRAMNLDFNEATARRSQDGMQRAMRGGLTVILVVLAILATAEIVMFAQDYLHALKG